MLGDSRIQDVGIEHARVRLSNGDNVNTGIP
jgi:hypothetical protein